ncbi:glycoside hydrolase family 16 protein [Polycladidibacter hongkongensis]|uniref:glycoside hydrolase family 16 protein n=1 Tax=Polycladidibacter hongkongensis TaxID=1647556 RepID=UPI00082E02C2|nr:glycoside hydrolase family 16 protein [Pseudovibrio hongkongensis]
MDRSSHFFEEKFDTPVLNPNIWIKNYLPHWSDWTNSKANYNLTGHSLQLFVSDEQRPWCSEFDGQVKVSGLQTGQYSGSLGSQVGQHRFSDELIVRTEVAERRLLLPHFCKLEIRARAFLNPWNLAALWLIGFEDKPEFSGEITVFEIFGDKSRVDGVQVGRGIKKIKDNSLVDEFFDSIIDIKVEDWHTYSIEWSINGIFFAIDGQIVGKTSQSPNYPMQLMLNFYEFPKDNRQEKFEDAFLEVDYVKIWHR